MKCQKCKQKKTKKDMMSNRTCKSCYIENSGFVKIPMPKFKTSCKECKTEYSSWFGQDNGYCEEHYYIEDQEPGICKKCTECKGWFCTSWDRDKCDLCTNIQNLTEKNKINN